MQVDSARTHGTRRLARRLAVGAAAAGIVLVATPGVASADYGSYGYGSGYGSGSTSAGPDVAPMLDCYTYNSDGTYTVVLGYVNTYSSTKTYTVGSSSNYSSPSSYNTYLPGTFKSGTNHAVFTVKVSSYDVNNGAYWYLNGHKLDYMAAAYASGVCSPGTVLPAEGNGTGMAIGLVVAGAVGAVGLYRMRKRTTATANVPSPRLVATTGPGTGTGA